MPAQVMIKIQRILFPTDFSEASKPAQEYACAFADQFGAELHVLYVLPNDLVMAPEPAMAIGLTPNFFVEQKAAAEKTLERLIPPTWAQGKSLHRATRMGNPHVEIGQYAREHDIDLLILGTHGRSALMHLLLGSVAEKVVRTAPCPVLTVRPAGHQFVMP